jgi:hypothetical protein
MKTFHEGLLAGFRGTLQVETAFDKWFGRDFSGKRVLPRPCPLSTTSGLFTYRGEEPKLPATHPEVEKWQTQFGAPIVFQVLSFAR